FLFLGLKTNDYPQMLAGSIVVIVLALLSEIVFSVLQRVVVPAGVSASSTHFVRARPLRSRSAVG
ncbi:MAG TPA: ABC transporter permease, partial [Terrimesophilobacter sp.]|nr:ABC transporter permease [Terrimesophilobacter sp.]